MLRVGLSFQELYEMWNENGFKQTPDKLTFYVDLLAEIDLGFRSQWSEGKYI